EVGPCSSEGEDRFSFPLAALAPKEPGLYLSRRKDAFSFPLGILRPDRTSAFTSLPIVGPDFANAAINESTTKAAIATGTAIGSRSEGMYIRSLCEGWAWPVTYHLMNKKNSGLILRGGPFGVAPRTFVSPHAFGKSCDKPSRTNRATYSARIFGSSTLRR